MIFQTLFDGLYNGALVWDGFEEYSIGADTTKNL